MTTEDYVSYETAKLLKEKGFKGECVSYYSEFVDDNKTLCRWRKTHSYVNVKNAAYTLVPTLQMAMKWLREAHDLHIMVDCIGFENYLPTIQFTHSCKDVKIESKINKLGGNGFDTYEEACKVAIKYCLENLI